MSDLINKPQITYIASYNCPDGCGDPVLLHCASRTDGIPTSYQGEPLKSITERIDTLLWVRDEGKEGSDNAEEAPD